MFTLLIMLLFSFVAFGQPTSGKPLTTKEMPSDYVFNKEDPHNAPIYQVLPDERKILSDADLGNAFQSLGIIARPDQDNFGLVFINGQPDYQFEEQEDKPFNLFIGTDKIIGISPKIFKKYDGKKLKVEYLTVKITRDDFNRLLLANNILIAYGAINYDVSIANLQAFRYVKQIVDGDYATRQVKVGDSNNSTTTSSPTSSGGTVNVKGYYRRDGTYVPPYTRRKPRN